MYRYLFTLPLVIFSFLGYGRDNVGTLHIYSQNQPPTITGQENLEIKEEEVITITLSDLIVEDPDNKYPEDFTLNVMAGENYSVSGTTITPNANFTGTLIIQVTVNDGSSESAPFDLQIQVHPVNDAPTITGQVTLETPEEQDITLQLSHLTVSDPDNVYPDDFTLIISSGSNYSVSGNTITPALNFNGMLMVPVKVNDGNADSAPFNVEIQVTAVNDAPSITGQQVLSTPEEQPVTLALTDLLVSDVDNAYPTGFSLTVNAGTNYTVSGTTITPDKDFTGTLSVPVTVNDGTSESSPFNVQIEVTEVNDAPVITGQQPLNIQEDQSITLDLSQLTVSDPDNAYPADFSLFVNTGTNYTVSGATVTPSPGFNGTLSVPVTVSDGNLSSAIFNLEIQVNSVNNPPEITGQSVLQIAEEQSLTIALENLIVSDPDNEYPTGFTLAVSSGPNYTVTGNTITPIANFSGTLSVPVTVNDGVNTSGTFNLQIEVLPQNDGPVITGQVSLTTLEDQAITIDFSHITVSDNDNSYPTGFTLMLGSGLNYTSQGNMITPALNYSGVISVPVTVNDGTTSSPVFNLSITVTPVNDAPVITAQVPLAVSEETPITLALSHFTVSDPDNTYPTGFLLSVSPGVNYTAAGTTVTPAANFSGNLIVSVTISDGTNQSPAFNTTISVGAVNDPPVITGQTMLSTKEETPLTILFTNLVVSDADNTYPQGFTMVLSEGTNYKVSGSTITPAVDFSGTLTIPVKVNDGGSNSNTFNLQVSVIPENDTPVIVGQAVLSTFKNKTITINLTDLVVRDPDNSYPADFSMKLSPGQNYTVLENTVTPANNFTGVISVPVIVNDGGEVNSAPFSLKIDVAVPPNVAPVITSQVTLTTYENQPIVLQLSNLVVNDPDNKFPDDFSLFIYPGANYSLNGNQVTPAKDYSGTLSVKVSVKDKQAMSEPYFVSIEVLPITDVPLITSQTFIRLNEDDSLVLKFSNLIVIDPDNTYPTGFTLTAAPGEHYTLKGLLIKPEPNYNGYLTVPVTVNDGVNMSTSYQLLVLVDPVNDAPVINDSEPGTLFFSKRESPLYIFKTFELKDVDDDTLSIAEITIVLPGFVPLKDTLIFEKMGDVRGIFDQANGALIIFGNGSVEEYQDFIRNVGYDFTGNLNPSMTKTFRLTVSDGKTESKAVEKTVSFGEITISLDIPSGFTPNGDGANDTWILKSTEDNEDYSKAIIRVYNKRGSIVFESKGFDREWDGRMNGVLLPADVYFYTIDLQGRFATNRYKGVVTILR